MDITIYRYKIDGANWSTEVVNDGFLQAISKALNDFPFQGDDNEKKYGFAHCSNLGDIIYGLFVQKFPKVVTDYDSETKKESKQETIDSGCYFFAFRPKDYQIHLQNKRSADLPKHEKILNRFKDVLKLAMNSTHYFFADVKEAEDEVDRDKIVKIFYEEADAILEMQFKDFDEALIQEQKQKRHGKRQTYFNPKEEYQEGMEEAAISLAKNAATARIKAKENCNLKKDPITRAMLEGSRQPTKIIYRKEETIKTDSAVTKKKEVISVEGKEIDIENVDQITHILSSLTHNSNTTNTGISKYRKKTNQTEIF